MFRVLTGFVALTLFSTSAWACVLPSNWDRVRDVPSIAVIDQVAVIRGKVESVGVKLAGPKSCITVYYSNVELYAGNAIGPYKLAICPRSDDFSQFLKFATEENSGSNRLLGMYKGADVVAALTKQTLNYDTAQNWEPPVGYFRAMRVDCLGLPQINLSAIPENKKTQYLSEFKDTVQKQWFVE